MASWFPFPWRREREREKDVRSGGGGRQSRRKCFHAGGRALRGPKPGRICQHPARAQSTDHAWGRWDPPKQQYPDGVSQATTLHGNTFTKEVELATVTCDLAFIVTLHGLPAPKGTRPGQAPWTTFSAHPMCRGNPGLHVRCWGAEVQRTLCLT